MSAVRWCSWKSEPVSMGRRMGGGTVRRALASTQFRGRCVATCASEGNCTRPFGMDDERIDLSAVRDTIRPMKASALDLAGRVLVAGFDGREAPASVLADLAGERLAGVI